MEAEAGARLRRAPPSAGSLLDEPTGGVDPISRRRFWRLIDEMAGEGVTVIVTTHYMDEAEHCDRIAFMHAGRLVALGSVSALKQIFAGRLLLEVRCARPLEGLDLLMREPFVLEAAVFGTRLHLVVTDEIARGRVVALLDQRGHGPASAEPWCRRWRTVSSTPFARRKRPPVQRPARVTGHEEDPRRGAQELRQASRDPISLAMLLGVPTMMLLLFGFALSFDVRHVALSVQDRDLSAASRRFVASFTNSTYFDWSPRRDRATTQRRCCAVAW